MNVNVKVIFTIDVILVLFRRNEILFVFNVLYNISLFNFYLNVRYAKSIKIKYLPLTPETNLKNIPISPII